MLALAAVLPGLASAALSTHVTVGGPRRVSAGRPVHLRISGYAGRGTRTLIMWVDTRRCARRARAEARRPRLASPVSFRVHDRFVAYVTVKRSVPGTHFACAYLVQRQSGRTVARASWRYVTRRRR